MEKNQINVIVQCVTMEEYKKNDLFHVKKSKH